MNLNAIHIPAAEDVAAARVGKPLQSEALEKRFWERFPVLFERVK